MVTGSENGICMLSLNSGRGSLCLHYIIGFSRGMKSSISTFFVDTKWKHEIV